MSQTLYLIIYPVSFLFGLLLDFLFLYQLNKFSTFKFYRSTHADQLSDSVVQALVDLLHEQLCSLFSMATGDTQWQKSVPNSSPEGKTKGKGTDIKDNKSSGSGVQQGELAYS